MYVCEHIVCVLLVEVRRELQLLELGPQTVVGTGNQDQVLYKTS